jgi:hypothetical protein
MSAFSDYLENEVLDHLFGASDYTPPATLYFGLFKTAPTDSGGTEVLIGTGGYARASLANNSTNFPAASAGAKKNAIAIVFPTATAAWGAVVGVGIFDAATGGNLLMQTSIPTRDVQVGDAPRFAVNGLTITLA